eukprot:Skav229705  [mRNA]  locus=scaffold49:73154:75937:+ [translate_table: standard]
MVQPTPSCLKLDSQRRAVLASQTLKLLHGERPTTSARRVGGALRPCAVAVLGALLCSTALVGRLPSRHRVLVTGGCGYIGSHTVVELLKADYEVLVLDDLSRSHRRSLDRAIEIAAGERLLPVDLRNGTMLEQIFANLKPRFDAVIHFAGYKSVGESIAQPVKYWENNVLGFVNLMRVLEKYQLSQRVLLSSSCTVYKPSLEKITEKHELVQEQLLRDKVGDGSSWSGFALRYFNPAGAHHSGLLGEAPHPASPAMFVPLLAQVALGQRERLEIFGSDYHTVDGTATRDYLRIQDLSEAHVAALEHLQKSRGFDALNLGTGHGHTVLQVVSAFEDVLWQKLPYQFSERRQGDAPFAVANPSRAHAVLGWRPRKSSLHEILSSHWNFVQKNPNGFQ